MQHSYIAANGHNWLVVPLVLALLAFAANAGAGSQENTGNSVGSGDVGIEPPTVRSIGLEWEISGDLNRDASVGVDYREAGTSNWSEGLPLFRLQNETVPAENVSDSDNANRPPEESRSITSLRTCSPAAFLTSGRDTTYEVRLRLVDPTACVARRAHGRNNDPRDSAALGGGNVYHVYPVGWGRAKGPTFVRRFAARLQLRCRACRLEPRVRAAGPARRYGHRPRWASTRPIVSNMATTPAKARVLAVPATAFHSTALIC